jgi:hypothetical protein
MRQLIFDRLSLDWSEVVLPLPPRLRRAGAALSTSPLRAFPVPGRLRPRSPRDVIATAEGLIFPRFEAYFLSGAFGAAKILLLDPSDGPDRDLHAIAGFIACCQWKSANDTYLCFDAHANVVIRPQRAMEKLFFSDQPLGLHCGMISSLLACILIDRGYCCRRGSIRNLGGPYHVFLDVFLPEAKRWVFVDADFGTMLARDDVLLSAEEVVGLRNAGLADEITIVPITDKRYTLRGRHFAESFSGQIAWRPEYMSTRVVSDADPYYRRVISEGFRAVEYHDFEILGGAPTIAPPADVPAPSPPSDPSRRAPLDFSD